MGRATALSILDHLRKLWPACIPSSNWSDSKTPRIPVPEQLFWRTSMFSCWSPFCVLKWKHQEIDTAFNSQKRNLHFTKLPIRIIYLPFFRFLNVGIFGSTYRNLAVYLSRDTFHKANKINYQTINFHFKVKQRNS